MNRLQQLMLMRGSPNEPVKDKTLVWYTPFTANYTEQISGITGQPTSNGICEIVADSRFGGYLNMHKYSGGNLTGLQFPNTANALAFGEGTFSMSFWLNAPYWNNYGQALISHRGNGTGWDSKNGFVIFKDSNYTMDLRVGASSTQSKSFNVPTDGKWHHVVVIRYDDGEVEWYLDGSLEGGGWVFPSGHDATCNSGVNVFIGGDGDWGKSAVFKTCHFRIWNRYLESEEIDDLYHEFDIPLTFEDQYFSTDDGYGYSKSLTADGGTGNYTFSTTDTLPAGVTLSSDGTLAYDGTWCGGVDTEIEVTCSDGFDTATATVGIVIAYEAVTISDTSYQVMNDDNIQNIVLYLDSGNYNHTAWTYTNLPSGFSGQDDTLTYEGYGTSAGTYYIDVEVDDGFNTDTATIEVTVEDQDILISDQYVTFNNDGTYQTYNVYLDSGQNPSDCTWSYASLPDGAYDSDNSIEYDGSSAQAGEYTATVEVSKGSKTATATLYITVTDAPTSISDQYETVQNDGAGMGFQLQPDAGEPYSYSWTYTNLPDGLSDEDCGFLYYDGSSSPAGSYEIGVEITSISTGDTANATLYLTIEDV